MSRAVSIALAAAVALGSGIAVGVGAYQAGHTAGRQDAFRQTDAVLRDLEHALAPLVQQQAQAHEPQTREEMP